MVVVNRKSLLVQFLQILSAESLSVMAERKFPLLGVRDDYTTVKGVGQRRDAG